MSGERGMVERGESGESGGRGNERASRRCGYIEGEVERREYEMGKGSV